MKNNRIKPILRLGILLITMMIVGQLGLAQEPYLVKDIRPGTEWAAPRDMVNLNGTLFFWANNQLWKSDGTEGGTVLVKDIVPRDLTNVNGTLFFNGDDGVHGHALWKSDGTSAGTVMVKDISPSSYWDSPFELTNVNGTLFFRDNDDVNGFEIWKSDGTEVGTVMVKDIYPGSIGSDANYLTNVNGTLFFFARGQLWKSDGTEEGTIMVKDLMYSPGEVPAFLTNMNGTAYFLASDGIHGKELWKSDGTETGTVMVKDINPGWDGSFPAHLTDVNGTLFFIALDGVHGWELWKSDGTETGTVMVKDVWPGLEPLTIWVNAPRWLTNVNGTVFFIASDGVTGYELWKSDGTATGTVLVKEILPGVEGAFYSDYASLTNVNGTLYFQANDGVNGYELWKSDGTAIGTILVKDINPGSNWSFPREFTVVNEKVFFSAFDEIHGLELWAFLLTPQTQIRSLISSVQALVAVGKLRQEEANALNVKLQAALASLNSGGQGAACNQLQAFINQVNAFIRSGRLSEADGLPLINTTNNIRSSIGC